MLDWKRHRDLLELSTAIPGDRDLRILTSGAPPSRQTGEMSMGFHPLVSCSKVRAPVRREIPSKGPDNGAVAWYEHLRVTERRKNGVRSQTYETSDGRHRLRLVDPKTWPPRYKLHKYWGRKPANVVAEYIRAFTEPGQTVLDPFCGSGVTVLEALIAKRSAVGVDLNPIAVRLAAGLLAPVELDQLEAAFATVRARVEPVARELYQVACRRCGAMGTALSTIWEAAMPVRVKLSCRCDPKGHERDLDAHERRRIASMRPNHPTCPDAEIYYGWQMQKLRRAGIRRFSELFTPRNLAILAFLRSAIEDCSDVRARELLFLTFSANLAQCTKMIADYRGGGGGPSWKLNSYWLPKRSQELNVWRYFENRFRKTCAAVRDAQTRLGTDGPVPTHRLATADSARWLEEHLEPDSIDFVFTDPPYGGEGIQYGELSMLWNLWLGMDSALEPEVAFNPYQDKDLAAYRRGLERVFSAARRTLRARGWMAVTFNNKDSEVWQALLDACLVAGFRLEAVLPMKRSAPNITEIAAPSAPKSDLVLLFQNAPLRAPRRRRSFDLRRTVLECAQRLCPEESPPSTAEVLDLVMCEWLKTLRDHAAVPDPGFGRADVEAVLSECGEYVKDASSRWRLRADHPKLAQLSEDSLV